MPETFMISEKLKEARDKSLEFVFDLPANKNSHDEQNRVKREREAERPARPRENDPDYEVKNNNYIR